MSVSDWIVALFTLTSGLGIVGFWVQRLAARRVNLEDKVPRLHVAAEFVTGAALMAGGMATFVDARAPWSVVTVGLGLGLLVYACVQSPAFYPEERQIRATLWLTLLGTIAVFALRVATL
ncbi:MAG: hypothetical protein ACXVES_12590 [Actinomycetota bacterium]